MNKIILFYLLFLLFSVNLSAEPVFPATSGTEETPVSTPSPPLKTGEPSVPAVAEEPLVFVHKVKGKINRHYKHLFTALENNGYYVIFEPNIGRNLAHFAKRWGKDYNKNNLDSIRSMVFCNGWYANKISNEDPNMLALCPLHVTLVHKQGYTRVLFIKPGQVSQGSAASAVALELEQDVIRIIKESVR